jgi:hypothetical protein
MTETTTLGPWERRDDHTVETWWQRTRDGRLYAARRHQTGWLLLAWDSADPVDDNGNLRAYSEDTYPTLEAAQHAVTERETVI